MKADQIGFFGIIAGALIFQSPVLWAGSHSADEDNFPDYNRLEYKRALPPVDQQVPPPPPGGIPLKVDMEQTSESEPMEAIPVRLGRTSQDPDDSEPSLTSILDDSHVSTSTAMAPPSASTASALSK